MLARFQTPAEPKPAGNVPVDKGFEHFRHRLADEHLSFGNRCLCQLKISPWFLLLSSCSCPIITEGRYEFMGSVVHLPRLLTE